MANRPGGRPSEGTSNALVPRNGILGGLSPDDVSGGLLKIFENTIEDLRALVTCRICVRPMYEPYMISCGHTFCYSCLAQWFCNHKSNKTCPDCRAAVKQQPAPAYVVREMTQIFISRAELMPEGENTQEHSETKLLEAGIVEKDKSNTDHRTGGLFRGCFRTAGFRYRGPIRDFEDGVNRCPTCNYELTGRECNRCGEIYSDSDVDSIGDGESITSEDDYSEDDITPSEDIGVYSRHDMVRHYAQHLLIEPDDISLDGDGYAIHTDTEYGNVSFGRRAAQDLVRRDHPHFPGQPGYAPSTLSTVDGFSDMEGEEDEEDEIDGDERDDEDDEEDEGSLQDFIVNDNGTPQHRVGNSLFNRILPSSVPSSAPLNSMERYDSEALTDYGPSTEEHWTDVDEDESDRQNASAGATTSHIDHNDNVSESSQSETERETERAQTIRLHRSRKRRRVVVSEDETSEDVDLDNESERSSQRRRLGRDESSEPEISQRRRLSRDELSEPEEFSQQRRLVRDESSETEEFSPQRRVSRDKSSELEGSSQRRRVSRDKSPELEGSSQRRRVSRDKSSELEGSSQRKRHSQDESSEPEWFPQRRSLSRDESSEPGNMRLPPPCPSSSQQYPQNSRMDLASATTDDEEDDEPRSAQFRARQSRGRLGMFNQTRGRLPNRDRLNRAISRTRTSTSHNLSSPNDRPLHGGSGSSRVQRNLVPSPLSIRDRSLEHSLGGLSRPTRGRRSHQNLTTRKS